MMRPMMVITTSISTRVKPCCPASLRSRPRAGNLANRARSQSRNCSRNCSWNRSWRFSKFMMIPSYDLANELGNREQRGHTRYDQAAAHRADGDDGERADDAHDPVQAALQFLFVEFGDPAGDRLQLPGFFAEPQHANRHRGKAVRRGERVRKFAAMAHAIS